MKAEKALKTVSRFTRFAINDLLKRGEVKKATDLLNIFHWCSQCSPTVELPSLGKLTPSERDLLSQGMKLNAIKAVRERTGLGLKEAKDLVEAAL